MTEQPEPWEDPARMEPMLAKAAHYVNYGLIGWELTPEEVGLLLAAYEETKADLLWTERERDQARAERDRLRGGPA